MQTLSEQDSGFEGDPRRRHELAMRPVADELYKDVFPTLVDIGRFEKANVD